MARGKRLKDRRKSLRKPAAIGPRHPLVGTWMEKGKKADITTVVYTITAKDGAFSVSGIDEIDGTALRISKIRWEGEVLHFISLYPPTEHRASHELLLNNGQAKHTISWADEDGNQMVIQTWIKRLKRVI